MLNIPFVNSLNFSNLGNDKLPFSVCWLAAQYFRNSDTLTYRFHKHNFFEIHFAVKGNVTYGFTDDTLTVRENEFLIIPPKSEHKVLKHSVDFEKLTLAVDCRDKDIYKALSSLGNTVKPMLENAQNTLSSVLSFGYKKTNFHTEVIYFLLCALVFELLECIKPSKQRVEIYDSRVAQAKKFIDDNFDVLFTCEEVANYCHISVKQLGRLFRKYENISLLDYIHNQKIIASKKLLKNKSLSIKEISQKLGFTDSNYFSKFFLRQTGMTPNKFREDQ